MAQTISTFGIRIKLDGADDARGKFGDLGRAASAMAGAIDEVGKAIGEAKAQGDPLRVEALKAANRELETGVARLGRLRAAARIDYARTVLDVKPWRDIQREADQVRGAYRRLRESGTLSIGESTQAFAHLQTKLVEIKQQTNGWADALGQIRTGLAGFAVGVGVFALGVRNAAAFESAMVGVQRSAALSRGETAALGEELQRMSTRLATGANDIARIASMGSKFGIPKQDLARFAELTTIAARQFEMLPDEAGRSLGMLSRLLKVSVKDMDAFVGMMNASADAVGVAERDIIQALTLAGVDATQFGLTTEQATALATAFLSTGATAEQASTAMRNLLGGLRSATQDGGEAGAMLKLLVGDVKAFSREIDTNAQGALNTFLGKLNQLNSADRFAALKAIFQGGLDTATIGKLVEQFGQYQQAQATAAQGAEAFRRQLVQLNQTDMGTLSAQFENAKNAGTNLATSIGQSILPLMKMLASGLQAAAEAMGWFVKTFPLLSTGIGTLATLAAGAGGLRIAIGGLALLFGKTATAAAGLWKQVLGTRTAMLALGAVGPRLAVLGTAIRGLLGPLGLIATALMLGIDLWNAWGNKGKEAGDKAAAAADRAREALDRANEARARLNQEAAFGSGNPGALREGIEVGAKQIKAKTLELVEAQRALAALRTAPSSGYAAAAVARDFDRATARITALRGELGQLQRDREANIAKLAELSAAGQAGDPPGTPGEIQRRQAAQRWADYIAGIRAQANPLKAALDELRAKAEEGGMAIGSPQYLEAEAAIRARYAHKPTGGAGAAAVRDLGAVSRAQADADLALLKDELQRAQTMLEEGYQDRLIPLADYYRNKTALELRENQAEQDRLRAQIASLQAQAAAAKPGERDRFLAELVQAQAQMTLLERKAQDITQRASRDQRRAELDAVEAQMSRAQAIIQAAEQSAQSRAAIGLDTETDARRRVTAATREQGQALARDLIPQIERLLAVATDPVTLAQLQATLDKIRQMQAEGRDKTAYDGLKQSVRDYAAHAADAFGNTRDAATRAFQGIEDALVELVTKGKADFKSLVASILADLARIQLRQALSKLFEVILGGGGGGNSTTKANALGGVYRSASLSAYSGGVYDKPQVFAFAKGIGLFGEAGPEAIMPLKRGRDGKLGVAASGGAGGNITVNVQVDASGQREGANGDQRGMDLGRRIQAAVKAVLVDEQRPGGLLAAGR